MEETIKNMGKQSKNRLDIRSELLFLLSINGVMIGNVKAWVIWTLVLFAGALLIFVRRPLSGVKYILVYGIMWTVEQALMLAPQNLIFSFIIAISAVLRRFIPFFMVGSLILQTTTVGTFMASMERIHMSKSVMIPLAVILRFFPAVKEEWIAITQAMKFRGIGLSLGNVIGHPLKTTEYILVPLLSSSVSIGEELSAAAISRGLGMEQKRSTIYQVDFGPWDYFLIVMALVFFCLITFL